MALRNSPASNAQPSSMNWLVENVARVALPIRQKLPVAFLIVVLLMVALSLAGLSELRRANIRAAELVGDQIRISTLRSIERSISAVNLVGAELFLNVGDQSRNNNLAKKFYDEVLLFRAAAAQTGNERRATHFLTKKYEREFFTKEREVQTEASKMRALYVQGDVSAARRVYDTTLSEALERFNRVVSSISFDLGREMQARVEENAKAFEKAQNLVVGTSVLAIATALMLGLTISASVTQPLDRIRKALGELSYGRFNARVFVPNRDEIGELAQHVNQTSAKLGELYDEVQHQKAELATLNSALEDKVKKQVQEIERANRLRRFLPAQIAELIVSEPEEEDILRTKRAEISVLFIDLRGFTAFANSAPPDRVIEALNAFHTASGPLIEASGGTLERFLGDGLLVLFGAPVSVENAAQKATELALDLRAAVRIAIKPFGTGAKEHQLGLGIGIGTGTATLGQIGFQARRDYSAIGPAPNLAARLCEQAKDGQILISQATANQIDFDLRPAGPFSLKGIGGSVVAFEL